MTDSLSIHDGQAKHEAGHYVLTGREGTLEVYYPSLPMLQLALTWKDGTVHLFGDGELIAVVPAAEEQPKPSQGAIRRAIGGAVHALHCGPPPRPCGNSTLCSGSWTRRELDEAARAVRRLLR